MKLWRRETSGFYTALYDYKNYDIFVLSFSGQF